MKLFWSSRSPFVRKVMVAAHELGLADRIACARVVVSATAPNAEVMYHNPLGKLPTLVLDDGSALYDSPVICEYLASLVPGTDMFPRDGTARWQALRRQALADGLMDTLLVWLLERIKPAEQQQAALIDGCRTKLAAVLGVMEHDVASVPLEGRPLDVGLVATAVALSYADFRFPTEGWRMGHPRLAAWHETVASRPSMIATAHADVY